MNSTQATQVNVKEEFLQKGQLTPKKAMVATEGRSEKTIEGEDVFVSEEQLRLTGKVLELIQEAEDILHYDKRIDMKVSGTTLCVALISNQMITCFNVGDSRAVVGRRGDDGHASVALALSRCPQQLAKRLR